VRETRLVAELVAWLPRVVPACTAAFKTRLLRRERGGWMRMRAARTCVLPEPERSHFSLPSSPCISRSSVYGMPRQPTATPYLPVPPPPLAVCGSTTSMLVGEQRGTARVGCRGEVDARMPGETAPRGSVSGRVMATAHQAV
jgi:hypothetical protein